MSKEKAYGLITKKASSVKIPEGRKISHQKAKEIRALKLKVFTLVKIPNVIIHLEIIFPMFLGLQALIIKDLMGLELIL